MQKIVMPKRGSAMVEGTIIKWHKKEGEAVRKGETLVDIMTDKVTIEVDTPCDGTLHKILFQEDSVVPINEIIAIIGETGENSDVPGLEKAESPSLSDRAVQSTLAPVSTEKLASPIAKRLAREHCIDINLVQGTGPRGRVVEADIVDYIKKNSPTGKPAQESLKNENDVKMPLTPLRKMIAHNLAKSYQQAVHVTSVTEADVTELTRLCQEMKPVWREEGVKLTLNAFIVKAVAAVLKRYPVLNAEFDGEDVTYKSNCNIGLAMTTDNGLVVPVLQNADKYTVKQIASTIQEYITKLKENRLSQQEMENGTFTISNVGPENILMFTPIIVPGQTAILGVSSIFDKLALLAGAVAARKTVNLCLSYDHRVIDGVPAARFRSEVKELLENPYKLLS